MYDWKNNSPASLASSSLGMPLILLYLTDEHFLFSCVWALNFTQLSILSTMPQLVALDGTERNSCHGLWSTPNKNSIKEEGSVLTARTNLSDRTHLDPKLFICRVMFSLVWESNDGFSISEFTKTQMWFFTWGTSQRKVKHFSHTQQLRVWFFVQRPGRVWLTRLLCSSSSPLQ